MIPREEAVFWMDENGDWWNEHGRFEKRRIIEYFHASIRHDFCGFYVEQENGDILERVYFPYIDTALFVIRIIDGENPKAVLNTGIKIDLDPAALFMENDNLYIRVNGVKAKFIKQGLEEVLKLIDPEKMAIKINGRQYPMGIEKNKGFVDFLKDFFKKIW